MRRGLLARTEQQDQQVPEAIQGQQEQLEIPVYRELPELRERMEQRGLQGQVVNLVYQERADLQVQPETQDRLEVMERQVQPEKPGQQAAQARQAQRARMALAGPQGNRQYRSYWGHWCYRTDWSNRTKRRSRTDRSCWQYRSYRCHRGYRSYGKYRSDWQ